MAALLIKTELARLALAPGTRTLAPRERMLVLLADGRRTAQELLALVAGTQADQLHDLVARGFLAPGTLAPAAEAAAPAPPPSASSAPAPVAVPSGAPVPADPDSPWTRPPAATKLYLLDLAERTFARSDPAQWEFLRDRVREVRDDAGLMQAVALVTQAISRIAGEDRATLIRRQLLSA